MDVSEFRDGAPGTLVAISGADPLLGAWELKAFVPSPLPREVPLLEPQTYLVVAQAAPRPRHSATTSTARSSPSSRRVSSL